MGSQRKNPLNKSNSKKLIAIKHKAAKPTEKNTKQSTAGASSTLKSFPIVGIGASAGGLEAFKELLGVLPVDTGMAFIC